MGGMECERVVFSGHAVRRMFKRAIRRTHVLEVLASGKVITEYPEDKPFPSCLMLGYVGGRPLHVVVAVEEAGKVCQVITVYSPDPSLWESDFEKRRSS